MTEPSVSFAGHLTDQPEVRYINSGIARATFRVAVSGRREQEASFFTVIVSVRQGNQSVEFGLGPWFVPDPTSDRKSNRMSTGCGI